MPKVSVVITNYNHEKYLNKRIDTVLAQTYPDYGVTIYDDCSKDNSREIIEKYREHPKVERIVYNDKNSGNLFKQWEKAIAEAKGEWIWIAQSDDYADPELLDSLVKVAEDNDNVGVAFCDSYWINEKDEEGPSLSIYHESFFRNGLAEIRARLSKQCSVQNASCAIIRRDMAVKYCKGISDYRVCGDWIFYMRILQEANIAFLGRKLNYFRWYHSNVSNAAIDDGSWIKEGLDIFKNMDFKNIRFSFSEFSSIIKWWTAIIFKSGIKNKLNSYKIIFKAVFKFFAASV